MLHMFKNNREKRLVIISFIIGALIFSSITGVVAYSIYADAVTYDNSTSGLQATNVKDAIDELYGMANNSWCKEGYTKGSDTGTSYTCSIIPVDFATASWDEIIAATPAQLQTSMEAGTTRNVDLGNLGVHKLRIANISTPVECSTQGFSQTACGLVIEFADIITNGYMNSNYYNAGGWPATSMRTYVNNDIYNALPTELKSKIIDTTVISGHGKTSGETNFTSTDKLYLLSTKEVWNGGTGYDTAETVTRQLDYYNSKGVTISTNYASVIKKNSNNNAYYWWLRSPMSNDYYEIQLVSTDGRNTNDDADANYGISPAFRIGKTS